MSTQLHKLPLDIVYRIFDYLNQNDLLLSVSHVCQRLDRILSSYEQFQSVTKYAIQYQFTRSDQFQRLFEALQWNSTIKELILWKSGIQNANIQQLSQALKFNKVLTKLALDNNEIGDEEVRYLSEGLKTNTTLKHLSLDHNMICNQGARHLNEALEYNKTLACLSLCDNLIARKGLILNARILYFYKK